MSAPLAQTSTSSVADIIEWSAILIAILVSAFAGYSRFKRWMNEGDAPAAAGFSFSDLRELHRLGKITDQEFETARVKMVASAKKMTAGLPNPLADNRKPPSADPNEPGSEKGL